MSLLGVIVNFCSFSCVEKALISTTCWKSGYKFLDKVAVPIGRVLVSTMVAEKTAEYADQKAKELKKEIKSITSQVEAAKVSENGTVIHNIFDNSDYNGEVTERDENGKPIAGRYPWGSDEEVTDNGNS